MLRRSILAATLLAAVTAVAVPASARASGPTDAQIARALGQDPPRAAAIYDAEGGRFLWARNPNKRLAPASLMKMATAVVALERVRPGDQVRISSRAARTPHDRVAWRRGATFRADEVMHGMLLESSNGAAVALAEHASGSVGRFRSFANQRLRAMGFVDTNLVDPSGLDAPGQYSTVKDLARLADRVMADPWLAGIVAQRSYRLPWPDGGEATFRNINRYRERDATAVGVKNGFTSGAGNTLAAAATRRGRTHIVIVLDGSDIYGTAARLMDLAFDVAPGTGPVEGPVEVPEAVSAGPAEDVTAAGAEPTAIPPVTPDALAANARGSSSATDATTAPWTLRAIAVAGVVAYAARMRAVDRRRRASRRRARAALARAMNFGADAVADEPTQIPWRGHDADEGQMLSRPYAARRP